jgi:hypothetical protein
MNAVGSFEELEERCRLAAENTSAKKEKAHIDPESLYILDLGRQVFGERAQEIGFWGRHSILNCCFQSVFKDDGLA